MVDYNYNFLKVVTNEAGDSVADGSYVSMIDGEIEFGEYNIDKDGKVTYIDSSKPQQKQVAATTLPAKTKNEKELEERLAQAILKNKVNLSILEEHYAGYDQKYKSLVALYDQRKALYESEFLKTASKDNQAELISAIEVVANLRKAVKDLLAEYKK
jgi:hypothetical protein